MGQDVTRRRPAVRARSLWPAAVLGLAVVCLAPGCNREQTALERAESEAARNPSTKTYLALGNAYSEAGANNDAYSAYMNAYNLDQKDAEVAYQLARVCFVLGDAERGMTMSRAALALNPRHAAAHEILGRHLFMSAKHQEAAAEWEEALRDDPGYLLARLNLVAAYEALNDTRRALAVAAQACRVSPREAQAHYTYADILERNGYKPLAEREYREAVRLNPKYAQALLRLSLMLSEDNRDLEQARNYAVQAADIDPGDGTAAAAAAWALFQLGKRTDALVELYHCSQATPYNFRVWLLFARGLKAEGHDKEAEWATWQAAEVSPRIPLTPQERERLTKGEQDSLKATGKEVDARKVLGYTPKAPRPAPRLPGENAPVNAPAGPAGAPPTN